MWKMRFVFVLLLLPHLLACENNIETTQLTGEDVLTLLPEETNVLVYLNITSLQESPFGAEIHKQMDSEINIAEEEEYQEFMEETGINLEEDVHEIWLAGLADIEDKTAGGAIIRGDFDQDRIKTYLENRDDIDDIPDQIKYEDREIYVWHDGDEDNGMIFRDNETILFGDINWLKTVIDNEENNRKNVLHNKTMAKCIQDLPYKKHIWGVLNLKELSGKWAEQIREKGHMFKGSKSIENMETVVLAIRLQDKADVYIRGIFATTEEADNLASMLNGFKAMAKLMVSDDKEAIDMLNDINIKSNDKELKITTEIHKEFIEKVQQKRRTFAQGNSKLLF